jgi:hypothetical protein
MEFFDGLGGEVVEVFVRNSAISLRSALFSSPFAR